MVDTNVPEHEELVGDSRTKKRVERKGLQSRLEALGNRLAGLPLRVLVSLELGEELEADVRMLSTLESGSALTRQRRRVAGYLRELDLDALDQRIEDAVNGISQNTVHRLERLRRELMEGGEAAIEALCEAHPDLDRQRLGQAARAARREAEAGAPGRRYKLLFQVLRELGLGQDPVE